jgi:TP53 regulating kinase-like protein
MTEPAAKKQRGENGEAVVPKAAAASNQLSAADASMSSAAASSSSATPAAATSSSIARPSAAVMHDDLLHLRLLQQGAEGRVYTCTFLGRPCVMKERFQKQYRHPQIDRELTRERMKAEVQCMTKARKQQQQQKGSKKPKEERDTIYTPTIYYVDEVQQRIYMEQIQGSTVKDRLQQLKLDDGAADEATSLALAKKIGLGISDIHSSGILHGDLTTSNLMLVPTESDPLGKLVRTLMQQRRELQGICCMLAHSHLLRLTLSPPCLQVVIDFGLASVSERNEERAVDLYVLERAFLSTHPNSEKMVRANTPARWMPT